jgi:hypothetical protein
MRNLQQRITATDQKVQFQNSWSDDVEPARQAQNEPSIA